MKKLSRNEMKNVKGGTEQYGSGTCAVSLPASVANGNGSGGTHQVFIDGDAFYQSPSGIVITGISKATVNQLLGPGVRWCCDSCATVSWIPS